MQASIFPYGLKYPYYYPLHPLTDIWPPHVIPIIFSSLLLHDISDLPDLAETLPPGTIPERAAHPAPL